MWPPNFNLGILYKHELRNPDAEAALKQVIAADSQDPSTWFNLGTVYFAEKKLDESLDAYHHVIEMGFGRGQNFYVAALFRTFTALVRLKRQDEAQKALKQWEGMHDKVPNISLQDPALEGGKYGGILAPPRRPRKSRAPSGSGAGNVCRDQPKARARSSRGNSAGGFRSAASPSRPRIIPRISPGRILFRSSAPPSPWGIMTMMAIRIFMW